MQNTESVQKLEVLSLLRGFLLGASFGVLHAVINATNAYSSARERRAQQLLSSNPAEWMEAEMWLRAGRAFAFTFLAPAYGVAAGIVGLVVFAFLRKTRVRQFLPALAIVGAMLFLGSLLVSLYLYKHKV